MLGTGEEAVEVVVVCGVALVGCGHGVASAYDAGDHGLDGGGASWPFVLDDVEYCDVVEVDGACLEDAHYLEATEGHAFEVDFLLLDHGAEDEEEHIGGEDVVDDERGYGGEFAGDF